MRELSVRIAEQIKALLIGIVCGAVISIVPLALINHKHLGLLFYELDWHKRSFISVCIVATVVLYMLFYRSRPEKDKVLKTRLLSAGSVIYFCLYTTCAALCQKLNLTVITFSAGVSSAGLILVIFGATMAIFRQLHGQTKDTTIFQHIDYSYLVFLTGVSLIFSVWLPMLALPGAFVVLKWMTKREAKAIIN